MRNRARHFDVKWTVRRETWTTVSSVGAVILCLWGVGKVADGCASCARVGRPTKGSDNNYSKVIASFGTGAAW